MGIQKKHITLASHSPLELAQKATLHLYQSTENILKLPPIFATLVTSLQTTRFIGSEKSSTTFFKGKRFQEEHEQANELEIVGEDIGGEAGIWPYITFVEPEALDELKLVTNISNDLNEVHRKNQKRVSEVIDKRSIKFKSDKMYQSQENIEEVVELLEMYPTDQGESIQDWDLVFSEGKVKLRGSGKRFNVEIVTEENLEKKRSLKSHSETHEIAKVYIVKNNVGQIVRNEIWFNHFNVDESHSRKIVEQVNKHFSKKINKELPPTIVREKKLITKKEGELKIFDIIQSFALSPAEEELISKTLSNTNPRLNRSVLFNLAWMIINNKHSSFVCVKPSVPREGEDSPTNGLNFALITKTEGFEDVQRFLNTLPENEKLPFLKKNITFEQLNDIFYPSQIQAKSLDEDARYFMKVVEFKKNLIESIRRFNLFNKVDLNMCKEGNGLTSILGTHLHDGVRKIFKTSFFEKENDAIENGDFQTSFVKVTNPQIANSIFISALNIGTQSAISELLFKNENGIVSRTYGYRFRNTKEEFENIKEFVRLNNKINHDDQVETSEAMKEYAAYKLNRFRQALASFCFLALMSKDSNDINEIEKIKSITKEALKSLDYTLEDNQL